MRGLRIGRSALVAMLVIPRLALFLALTVRISIAPLPPRPKLHC